MNDGAPRIGFIGAGRLGKALAWSFAERGLDVVCAASRDRASAEALASRIPGCEVMTPQRTVDACDLVFVTTPDAAIAPTAGALRWRPGMAAVHCSGVTELAALGKAARDGAAVGGFHPLQTFGDPLAALRSLPGCTVTIEAEPPLEAALVAIAERLGCPVNRLPPGMRGRYHAAAGYTSQFINVLFDEAAAIWRSWDASEADAVRALLPMARGTLAAIESAGIAGGMPGPVSRGDVSSVDKHVRALAALDAERLALYGELCARTVTIAARHGALPAATAAAFDQLLAPARRRESRFMISQPHVEDDTDMTTEKKTYTKRLGILRKKEGMSDEAFRDHWLTKHAALCAKLPGLRRYSVNFVERGRFAHFDYDGFSELWFDDEPALTASLDSPEGKTLLADLPNFTSHIVPIVSVETQIVWP